MGRLSPLLQPHNVRGATPLDQITRYLRQQLYKNASSNKLGYVVFTDGEPSSKLSFERELRQLASDVRSTTSTQSSVPTSAVHSLFLTVNLCTDQDDVVEYYNDLDQKLGTELSGMDV